MLIRLLKLLYLIKPNQHVKNVVDMKVNPYKLVWYRSGWSKSRIERNNTKYWTFEIEYNGIQLP